MANTNAIWGIDLGQCALKALRCSPHPEDPTRIQADAFDYIEYPKLLNQPEADVTELVRDALAEFLARNQVKGDRVAISVAGQSGLTRFVKLPPVESKKIPDIVRFEARQQIPFPLHDVVWDYQQMAGGAEEEGFALETEVGLFAMKRDQVFRALKPFDDARIEIDAVQLAPLALFNFAVFDQMKDLPKAEDFDPDSPPESVVILSIGTETSDLVVTNGFRVWQRNIPIGGSHFTRSLSKELKLTFAKAEHLKRNARQASQDPKAVFRAMRPVFNDLLAEIQLSISYFSSIDRKAKINRMIALGNAVKLPGLTRFVSQNLGYEVAKPENFDRLAGRGVTASPQFKDNMLSFATCYGLCVQGLAPQARIRTNLMPREVLVDRTIRNKKPWVMAAAAAVVLGLTINYALHYRVRNSVHEQYVAGGVSFKQAFDAAQRTIAESSSFKNKTEEAKKEFAKADAAAQAVVRSARNETTWLEAYKAIEACLPYDAPTAESAALPEISNRRELHITDIQCTHVPDLAKWFERVKEWPPYSQAGGDGPPPEAAQPADGAAPPPAGQIGPKGPGWVFRVRGHHFFNSDPRTAGQLFVLNTLIKNINDGEKKIPAPPDYPEPEISVKDVGLGFAVLIDPKPIDRDYDLEILEGQSPAESTKTRGKSNVKTEKTPRFGFEVQFCWQPRTERPAATQPNVQQTAALAADTTRN